MVIEDKRNGRKRRRRRDSSLKFQV